MRYDELIAQCGLPRAEARVLLEHCTGCSREWLIAHGDEQAPAPIRAHFTELVDARSVGEPIAYLVGWREFFGHRFAVTPAVLIPRPETEMLVDAAVADAPRGGSIIDLGTGSGCIAISIAIARPDLTVVATDASASALAVAQRNARTLCADALAQQRLQLRVGDWWQACAAGERFALIVSNPPYIPAADRHLSEGDLRHEPAVALTDYADGLSAIKIIIEKATAHIECDRWLLLEHAYDQGAAVRRLLAGARFEQVMTRRDAAGLDRVTRGKSPACAQLPEKAENRESH